MVLLSISIKGKKEFDGRPKSPKIHRLCCIAHFVGSFKILETMPNSMIFFLEFPRFIFLILPKVLKYFIRFDGLWVQCEQMPNGNTNCESYNVFFIGLPGKVFNLVPPIFFESALNWFSEVLQTCRALMIAAIGLGFLGILLSVLGMKCTSVGASNHKAKARTALLGGLMLGVAGRYARTSCYRCCSAIFKELLISAQRMNLQLIWCSSCYFKVFYR